MVKTPPEVFPATGVTTEEVFKVTKTDKLNIEKFRWTPNEIQKLTVSVADKKYHDSIGKKPVLFVNM